MVTSLPAFLRRCTCRESKESLFHPAHPAGATPDPPRAPASPVLRAGVTPQDRSLRHTGLPDLPGGLRAHGVIPGRHHAASWAMSSLPRLHLSQQAASTASPVPSREADENLTEETRSLGVTERVLVLCASHTRGHAQKCIVEAGHPRHTLASTSCPGMRGPHPARNKGPPHPAREQGTPHPAREQGAPPLAAICLHTLSSEIRDWTTRQSVSTFHML